MTINTIKVSDTVLLCQLYTVLFYVVVLLIITCVFGDNHSYGTCEEWVQSFIGIFCSIMAAYLDTTVADFVVVAQVNTSSSFELHSKKPFRLQMFLLRMNRIKPRGAFIHSNLGGNSNI